MRVKRAATAANNRGTEQAIGGLPSGGQRCVKLGPTASGGHHPLLRVHGGYATPSDNSCIPTPEDPVSGGEVDHQTADLHGGHLRGVGQAAVSEASPRTRPGARTGLRPPTSAF